MNNVFGKKRMESKKFIVVLVSLAILSLFPMSMNVLSDIAYYPDHDPPYYVWTPWLYSWARQYGSDCHVSGFLDGWTYDKQNIVYGGAGFSSGDPSSPYWTPDHQPYNGDFENYQSYYYLDVWENIYFEDSLYPIDRVEIIIKLYADGHYDVYCSHSPS